MKSIYNLSRENLEQYFIQKNIAKFRAVQVFEAIYRHNNKSFTEITNINKEIKKILSEDFIFNSLIIENKEESSDGTIKYLFKLNDGNFIETVLMHHNYGDSVCVTSEVGCNMGCKFCESGVVKKIRNLDVYEMVLQVLTINDNLLKEGRKVSHVVVMGIGEPFDNYDNVMEFIKIINDAKGLEIGSRHITVSTCGIVPKIKEFSLFPLQVNLAISLHFPNDNLRSEYMPINRKYNLNTLIQAIKDYYNVTNRRVTFEYILLDGINDDIDNAKELVKLIKGLNAYVNLIPYNSTCHNFKRTTIEKRDRFFDYLNKNGVNAIIRKEFGSDIDAACGQLRIKKMKEEKKDE